MHFNPPASTGKGLSHEAHGDVGSKPTSRLIRNPFLRVPKAMANMLYIEHREPEKSAGYQPDILHTNKTGL